VTPRPRPNGLVTRGHLEARRGFGNDSPPYAVPEQVFDEYDIEGCLLTADTERMLKSLTFELLLRHKAAS
jgi:hypothetical protein